MIPERTITVAHQSRIIREGGESITIPIAPPTVLRKTGLKGLRVSEAPLRALRVRRMNYTVTG